MLHLSFLLPLAVVALLVATAAADKHKIKGKTLMKLVDFAEGVGGWSEKDIGKLEKKEPDYLYNAALLMSQNSKKSLPDALEVFHELAESDTQHKHSLAALGNHYHEEDPGKAAYYYIKAHEAGYEYPTESIMHVFTRGHPNLLPIEGSDDGTKWHKIVGHLQAFTESSDVVEITAALDTIKEYKETSDDLSDLQLTLLKSLNTIFDAYVEKDAAEEDAGKEKEAGEEKEAEEKADL